MNRKALPLTLLCFALTTGCERGDALQQIQERGELVVVSRNGPTTYYQDKDGPAGFEHALTEKLALELGVTLKMEPAFSLQGIFTTLTRQEADIAAAGLTLTESRAKSYPHSAPYETLITQLVYKSGYFKPRKLEDLLDMSIVVLANSSHVDTLQALRDQELPTLKWQELAEADTMELLELVYAQEAQLALIDSSEFEVLQSLFPRLKLAMDLGSEQQMVWYLQPGRDNSRLKEKIDEFLTEQRSNGVLDSLREVHFGHIEGVSRIGSHTFTRKMEKDLPPYRDLIQEVAAQYQMDWRLLAAIAYQESHWNPKAASPTGVRGMMMLTLPTAREMGVTNRLDAAQSLRGGTRYFKNMKRRLPEDIVDPDRTWLALAAYNIGMGHLHDARALTEQQGGNPNLWRDVMQRLPLLQKRAHYKNTRYGYARGQEAVTYVQNIRHYYSILQWQDLSESQVPKPLAPEDYMPRALERMSLKGL